MIKLVDLWSGLYGLGHISEERIMENQHRKITGYRELNQAEIDLMNDVKAHGRLLEELLMRIGKMNSDLSDADDPKVYDSEAYRWLAIAKTDLQTGLMAAVRAVAKPEFF